MSENVELVTLFIGGNHITYELQDFTENGMYANPIRQILNPHTTESPVFELGMVDGFMRHSEPKNPIAHIKHALEDK